MFIPFFIAALMGLISPTYHTLNCKGGIVEVSNSESDNSGAGNAGGTKDVPGPGPSGDTGQTPPPKP